MRAEFDLSTRNNMYVATLQSDCMFKQCNIITGFYSSVSQSGEVYAAHLAHPTEVNAGDMNEVLIAFHIRVICATNAVS